MRLRPAPRYLAAAAAMLACGLGGDATPPVEAPPPSRIDAEAVSGRYEMRGVTVQATTGRQRKIAGALELDVDGPRYDVSFELATTAPDFDDPVPVTVRGSGSGFVVGKTFVGTTEEWMTLDAAPGTEQRLPERAGLEIVSSSQGSFEPDGTFQVVLQNAPGRGQHYAPSITVLTGRRTAR